MKTPDQIPGMKTIGDFDKANDIGNPPGWPKRQEFAGYLTNEDDFGGPHPVPSTPTGGLLVALVTVALVAFAVGGLIGMSVAHFWKH